MRQSTVLCLLTLLLCCSYSVDGGAVASMAAALLKVIATELTTAAVNKIGVELFGAIFRESIPSYFDDVYKEIEKVMKKTITSNTISELNGQINGLAYFVNNTYNPRKNSSVNNSELFAILEPQVHNFEIDVMGVLQEESYEETALGVFVIGASMHLMLIQELARIDPHAAHPSSSSYIRTLRICARRYARHARDAYDTVTTRRTSDEYITENWNGDESCGYLCQVYCTGTGTHCRPWVKWTDKFENNTYKFYAYGRTSGMTNYQKLDLAEQTANWWKADHIRRVKINLHAALNKPNDAATEYEKLIYNPLPELVNFP